MWNFLSFKEGYYIKCVIFSSLKTWVFDFATNKVGRNQKNSFSPVWRVFSFATNKVHQSQKNALWRDICFFFDRSISTLHWNLNVQLFLAEVLWKGTNEKMTDIGFSAKQTDDSIHIYDWKSHSQVVLHQLNITDSFQAWLFSEHWNSL